MIFLPPAGLPIPPIGMRQKIFKARTKSVLRISGLPFGVLLQRSLIHSASAQISPTIIHSARSKGLNKKIPTPSFSLIQYLPGDT